MLDALIGRSFASKCKSLIKTMKTRIELIRKKRSAREKFLKKDIADLLASGLDVNAYGRMEGLMAELTLSSCYEFVEQCCDLLYKQLSAMGKKSECPEECKAAAASLMFAAARVSDLPELRELREIFQEKYGNSLQYYVNQKFIEDLSSHCPTIEKKIQLMQEIAAEYSISWNSMEFEKQMAKPPVHTQEKPSRYGSIPVNKLKADGGYSMNKKDERGEQISLESSGRQDIWSNGQMPHESGDDNATRKADDKLASTEVKESQSYKHQQQNEKHFRATTSPATRFWRSYDKGEQDGVQREHASQDKREAPLPKREMRQTLSHGRQEVQPPTERPEVPSNNKDGSVNVPNASKTQYADILKARSFNKMIPPPPYVRPPKPVKAENDLLYTGFSGKDSSGLSRDADAASQRTSSCSIRTGTIENAKKDDMSSSCRRRDTKQGLQILFDDEPRIKDEERVLDKVLMHHSARPIHFDTEKFRRKSDVQAPRQMPSEASDTQRLVENKAKPGNVTPVAPSHTRSVSLPSEQSVSPEQAKVFARAASFLPDRPPKHVHPNLPDCDELAARIAALRGSK